MADNFHDEVRFGEHDHHVSSGVHKKRADAGGGLAAMTALHARSPKDVEGKKLPSHAPATMGQGGGQDAGIKPMSVQDHLDAHDEHRGMENLHRQKAKQAAKEGNAWNEAHHTKQAEHHRSNAEHHESTADSKRLGGPVKKSLAECMDIIKGSGHKSAGVMQQDVVFQSEDQINQDKMRKMGLGANNMLVMSDDDMGRGSKSFGLQYSKRVRKYYGMPD